VNVGDLVEVETRFHGKKIGTIIEEVSDSYGTSWVIHIPNHWTSATIAEEQDIRVIV